MSSDRIKIVVLDAETLGDDLDLSILRSLGETTIFRATPENLIATRIIDANVVIANKAKLNEGNLVDATQLKLIALPATGYDNVDLDYCRRRGIAVTNVAGYSTSSVAQVTVATALYLYNHIRAYTAYVESGAYSRGGCFNHLEPVYREIDGKTWGIIGYGNIGARVASIASAFGCNVIAYTRTPRPGVVSLSLEQVCRESDIISIHTPLTAETRSLIGANEIAWMKEGCVLINEARGAVVDESAVAKAVLDGRILYGCDVYETEPFTQEHPYTLLLGNENVCLTPHMAWGAKESRERCIFEVAENIRAFIGGNRRNRVD